MSLVRTSAAVALTAFACAAVPAQILINEVHGFGSGSTPALPGDYVELWNQTPNAISLAGWTIGTWVGDTGTVTTRVIPCSPEGRHIIPGNCFWIFQEAGTLGGPLTGTLAGLSGMTGLPTTFSSTSNIGIYLLDPMGNCVDYVYLRRGTTAPPATPPNLPAGCTFTVTNIGTTGTNFAHIHRLTNTDTNTSTDFAQTATTDPGTPGAPNNTGTATQTSLGSCVPGAPVTAAFETNSPAARLSLNNLENTAFSGPVELTICTNEMASLQIESTLVGQPWDLCYTTTPAVAAATLCAPGNGGITTANGQVINLDLNAPDLACLNNLQFNNMFPGNMNLSFSVPNPVPNSTAQFIIRDPSNPDGFQLSAPVQLHVVSGGTQNLTLADDGSQTITLAGAPICSTTPFIFCGQSFTQITVNANGRVFFGGTGDTDFSPTVAEALADPPFVGFWTDLDPAQGGTISVTNSGGGIVRVDWTNVPFHNEPTTANTFSILLNGNSNSVTLDGLQGIVPNPATGSTTVQTADAQFLGMSCGNLGATTNPGVTNFTTGGGACQAVATDMIYDFIGSGGTPPSIVPSLAGASTLNSITFTPIAGGAYCWSGN